jgi:hypothetical protein
MNTYMTRLLATVFVAFAAALAPGQTTTVTLLVNAKPALALTAPADAKVTSSNGYVNIRTTNMSLHVWAVPNAATAKDALPLAADLIKSEFIKCGTTVVEDIVVAGAPAKHVLGSGNEADDGDPGNAEVVLFAVGTRVFAGCVHGEFDDASRARAPMMTLLQTAHSPP